MNYFFFSICTPDFLPHACALYQSIRKTHSAFKFVLVLTERLDGLHHAADFPFELIYLHELPQDLWQSLIKKYDRYELCSALRPGIAKYLLLSRKLAQLIFLDADILVTGSFDTLKSQVGEHSFCITPHINSPYPLDGQKPDDITLATYGVYNGGFWLVQSGDRTVEMLDYLIARFERYCYNSPPKMFVGQNLFPLFISLYAKDCCVITDPAFNVAYWNIHERAITEEDGTYYVNGKPVVFFHFSGFDAQTPEILTRWPHRRDNASYPAIIKALHEYLALLICDK